MAFNPQAVIGGVPERCPACGADNAIGDRQCGACGRAFAADEDDENQLDVISSEGVPAGTTPKFTKKAPVEKSKNLLSAQEAAAGIQDGSMARDSYQAKVEELKRVAEQGVQLMGSAVVKAKVASLPPEQQEVSKQTAICMAQALEGYKQMLYYLSSGDVEDVRSGLRVVEKAFYDLDKVRERILDLANAEEAAK
ncbi:MAG TPA: zinc ribbon domain-containing protein [Candidatus Xenobia bacterium]|jgi:hypothetical protein